MSDKTLAVVTSRTGLKISLGSNLQWKPESSGADGMVRLAQVVTESLELSPADGDPVYVVVHEVARAVGGKSEILYKPGKPGGDVVY